MTSNVHIFPISAIEFSNVLSGTKKAIIINFLEEKSARDNEIKAGDYLDLFEIDLEQNPSSRRLYSKVTYEEIVNHLLILHIEVCDSENI